MGIQRRNATPYKSKATPYKANTFYLERELRRREQTIALLRKRGVPVEDEIEDVAAFEDVIHGVIEDVMEDFIAPFEDIIENLTQDVIAPLRSEVSQLKQKEEEREKYILSLKACHERSQKEMEATHEIDELFMKYLKIDLLREQEINRELTEGVKQVINTPRRPLLSYLVPNRHSSSKARLQTLLDATIKKYGNHRPSDLEHEADCVHCGVTQISI